MEKYQISYGLNGSLGGQSVTEEFDADNNNEAEKIGRSIAVKFAEHFEGKFEIPSIKEYGESCGFTNKDDCYNAWIKMMDDMWIVYTVTKIED